MKLECENPVAVAHEFFWLAYQASRPMGMGHMRSRDDATKEMVWESVTGKALTDYAVPTGSDSRPRADYVFGRMMKVRLTINADSIEVPDGETDREYQGWCGQYPTFEALGRAAIEAEVRKQTQ